MKPIPTFQTMAALVILVIFFGFAFYVAHFASTSDPGHWSRLYSIFASIEALGFAAAGMVLGRTIDAPQVAAVRRIEKQNSELLVRKEQAEETLDVVQKELLNARESMESMPVPPEQTHDTNKTLERALMRIETVRKPNPKEPRASKG